MFDAYTVRKAVPRILLAVIGINVSIYLCVAAVEITTIIGRGISDLLVSGFHADQVSIDGKTLADNGVLSAGFLAALVILAFKSVGIVTALVGSLMPLILIVVLIALAVLFTLIIRQALIIFLTVVSPVAIACFVLPGTEKYFKKWFDLFVKTLMVYPIIAVIFAMSTVMGSILLRDASNATASSDVLHNTASLVAIHNIGALGTGGESEQAIKVIAAIIVIYAPLVLIPFAFKLAGGAISAVMNAASGATERRRRELGDNRRKSLGEARAARNERAAAGHLTGGRNAFTRGINTAAQTASIMRGGKISRSRIQAERSVRDSVAYKKAMENEYVQAVMSNDDLLDAYANDGMNGARRYFEGLGMTGSELERNLQGVALAEKAVGAQTFGEVAAVANAATGSGYSGGSIQMLRAIDRAAGGDRMKRGRMIAAARANGERANRPDLAPSFSATAQTLAAIDEGRLDDDALARDLDREVIRTKGASAAMQSRGQAADRLIGSRDGRDAGALGSMLTAADAELAAANADMRRTQVPTAQQRARVEAAETESLRVQAVLANMYDTAAYGPEENQERLGRIMAQGSGMTVRNEDGTTRELTRLELLDRNRQDSRFRAFRREMGVSDTSSLTPEQRAQLERSVAAASQEQH